MNELIYLNIRSHL